MTDDDPWTTLHQEVQLHTDYLQGCRYLQAGDIASARTCFLTASQQTTPDNVYSNLYDAASGYVAVMLGDFSGLNVCRRAAQRERHQPDVFEYLARAELRLQHRKQACGAIARGLKIDKHHKGLRDIRQHMGVRRNPIFRFLGRDNPLNVFLGRLTYGRRAGRGNRHGK